MFRSVDRHGNIGVYRLDAKAVTLIVKRAAQRAGVDPTSYSGHSLRAGFVTSAAVNGASERAIAVQTGHRSMEVLRRYVRHATVFTGNAATMLGLQSARTRIRPQSTTLGELDWDGPRAAV